MDRPDGGEFAAKGGASPDLVRGLKGFDATMIVAGSMIGSGIFLTSAESARLVGSVGWLLAAWGLAGVLTMTGAACCAELAAMMPDAGGPYVFFRTAYGRIVGFVYGWAMFLVIQTGTIAAVAVAFANFLGVLTPAVSADAFLVAPVRLGPYAASLSTQQLAAVASILLLTALNVLGQQTGKWIQNTFTTTKLAALLGLIAVGLFVGWNSKSAALDSYWWNSTANGWTAAEALPSLPASGALGFAMLLGLAMVGPLFSQTAWNNVTFTGAEVADPSRSLPRALLVGCGLVVALYLSANLAYAATLPLESIQHAPGDRVGTALMEAVFGGPGAMLMAAAIVVSTFGCNNGLILAGARVFYAMAKDGLFWASLARLNRWRVPGMALAAQGVWASLLTLVRTVDVDAKTGEVRYGNVYSQLLEYIVATEMVFYLLLVGAVVALRRRAPSAARPYRTLGYPATPALYIAIAVAVLVDLIVLKPQTSGIGFAIVLTGVPVFWVWRRRPGAAATAANLP
jgi:APA family basic amino acid/polyamine antiporter